MSETYRVVVQGLTEGFSSELATERLMALFKSTKERIQPLLEPRKTVVKKGLDRLAATKYKDALERCGCLCRIEPELATVRPLSEQHLQTLIPRIRRYNPNDVSAGVDAPLVHRLVGDLAISFTYKQDGTDTAITARTLEALGIGVDELCTLAKDNLYRIIHPALTFKQMRLQKPGEEDASDGMRFFSYLETGDGLEATCILLAPIWGSVKELLVGPLRIVVPTQNMCMFCGADDAITFAMMRDISRDLKKEAGESGLSDLIYTVDAAGVLSAVYLDGASQATDPGAVTLSEARLRELQPELFSDNWSNEGNRQSWRQLISDQLQRGDSRAAVVINAEQRIVAAYTDELDCVALLQFDPNIARAKGWRSGTRLLTVNIYVDKDKGLASDLMPGPNDSGNFGNYRPLIADLLTDDLERVEYRKSQIAEEEWLRALEMGKQALKRGVKPRDGRPISCGNLAKAQPKATVQRPAAVAEPEPAVSLTYGDLARFAGAMLFSFWLVWLGISHVRSMSVDLLYFVAWLGILFFAAIGVYCARAVVLFVRLAAKGGL